MALVIEWNASLIVVQHAVGGVIGLIVGMLVEAFLFIIRAVRHEESEDENKRFTSTSKSKATRRADSSDPDFNLKSDQSFGWEEIGTGSGNSNASLSVNSRLPSSLPDGDLETAQKERGDSGVEEDALSEASNDFERSLRQSRLGIRKRIVV